MDPEKLDFVETNRTSNYDETYPEKNERTDPTGYDPVLNHFSDEEIKKIVRRVDLRLIPLCGLMYCVSLLDRTNLSNAAIAG